MKLSGIMEMKLEEIRNELKIQKRQRSDSDFVNEKFAGIGEAVGEMGENIITKIDEELKEIKDTLEKSRLNTPDQNCQKNDTEASSSKQDQILLKSLGERIENIADKMSCIQNSIDTAKILQDGVRKKEEQILVGELETIFKDYTSDIVKQNLKNTTELLQEKVATIFEDKMTSFFKNKMNTPTDQMTSKFFEDKITDVSEQLRFIHEKIDSVFRETGNITTLSSGISDTTGNLLAEQNESIIPIYTL